MTYENRPIIQALETFHSQQAISFHVPGHKNGELSGLPDTIRQALQYDLTELTGLDDLHEPEEAIKEAEEKLSRLYGSSRSFFLVNGSTVGNIVALYTAAEFGDTVLVQRNAHKSIFHAVELVGAKTVFLPAGWDEKLRAPGGVSFETVKEALCLYPQAKVVLLTSPSYYGTVNRELAAIIEYCHEREIAVIVDEAHGAHFIVHKTFPESALMLGADIVVQSAHKTLPAMTMASFLHVRSKLVDSSRAAHYLRMLQSSSPSYLLLASLDDARYFAETYNEEDYAEFSLYRGQLIEQLSGISGLHIIEPDDLLKLLMRLEGASGFMLQKALEKQGIYTELADLEQVLLILPLVKRNSSALDEQMIEKFKRAVQSVKRQPANEKELPLYTAERISAAVYTAGELQRMESIWVQLEETQGRVMAEAVIPYPPGIPLLCAGERVTAAHIQQIAALAEAGAKFQGAVAMKPNCLKVIEE